MTRPTLISGDVLSADLANAAGNPILDGADEYGHGAKVIDDWLDDQPDQLKARFYNWRDRLKVSATSGLQVSYTGTVVLNTNGDLTTIEAGSLTLPNNSTGYIFINNTAEVIVGSAYPEIGIMLAKYTTLAGAITDLTDLRYQALDIIQPLALPEAVVFAVGDIKPSARLNPQPGWLLCDGAAYNVSLYPSLASAIGTTYSLPGDTIGTFRVPDLRGRTVIGVGDGRSLGQQIGEREVNLNTNNLPSHNHVAVQSGHTHTITTTPHTHSLVDNGHSHGLVMNPHNHSLNDPGHAHQVASRDSTAGFGVGNVGAEPEFVAPWGFNSTGLSQSVWTSPVGSNLSINASTITGTIGLSGTGLSVNPSAVGCSADAQQPPISVGFTGSNVPHNNMQPSLVLSYFIRAF